MTGRSIVVVSNDPLLVGQVAESTSSNGIEMIRQTGGDQATACIMATEPILTVVDKTIRGTDGFLVCRKIRDKYEGALIIVGEVTDERDELLAFKNGADDYIARPIRPRILEARVGALLRRTCRSSRQPTQPVRFGNLVVDPTKREGYLNDRPMGLTTIQFDLLWHLTSHPGTVVSRDELNRVLYDTEYNGIDRSIDVYISRLRHKLGDDPCDPVYLKTVRGVGYLFTGPDDAWG